MPPVGAGIPTYYKNPNWSSPDAICWPASSTNAHDISIDPLPETGQRIPEPTGRRCMTQSWLRPLLRAAGGWMFQGGLHRGPLRPLAVGPLDLPAIRMNP